MSALNLDPLLHMLGLDEHHAEPWRNHYVTSGDNPEIAPLVAAGLVREARTPGFLAAGDHVYLATEAGRVAALAEHGRRHPNPSRAKPSRAKTRYLAWLRFSDACCDVTFGEYLRQRLYARASREDTRS